MGSPNTSPKAPEKQYLPALRWHVLTPAYDLVVRATSGERRFKQRLVHHARLQAGERVLDVGCGTGTLMLAGVEKSPRSIFHGVDRDPQMLRRAANRASTQEGIGLCVGDARDLPVAAESIDVALSSLFFHHLLDDAKTAVLSQVARVLRPGGRLVIADWGEPRSPASRLGASLVRAFDGADPTRTNFAGRLASHVAAAGFVSVDTVERIGVPLGVVDIIVALAPASTA